MNNNSANTSSFITEMKESLVQTYREHGLWHTLGAINFILLIVFCGLVAAVTGLFAMMRLFNWVWATSPGLAVFFTILGASLLWAVIWGKHSGMISRGDN